ncbi:hypothetical protein OG21DRAFT_413846 [Imleria badia]|nr:hypothetical protein OG21DRAFT_413846 [Imleria badia]
MNCNVHNRYSPEPSRFMPYTSMHAKNTKPRVHPERCFKLYIVEGLLPCQSKRFQLAVRHFECPLGPRSASLITWTPCSPLVSGFDTFRICTLVASSYPRCACNPTHLERVSPLLVVVGTSQYMLPSGLIVSLCDLKQSPRAFDRGLRIRKEMSASCKRVRLRWLLHTPTDYYHRLATSACLSAL